MTVWSLYTVAEFQKLEAKLEQLRHELQLERERIQQSVRPLSATSPVPMLASTPDAVHGIDLEVSDVMILSVKTCVIW